MYTLCCKDSSLQIPAVGTMVTAHIEIQGLVRLCAKYPGDAGYAALGPMWQWNIINSCGMWLWIHVKGHGKSTGTFRGKPRLPVDSAKHADEPPG